MTTTTVDVDALKARAEALTATLDYHFLTVKRENERAKTALEKLVNDGVREDDPITDARADHALTLVGELIVMRAFKQLSREISDGLSELAGSLRG